ncbi:hypothetical protein FRC02_011213 [Tulasnella sp. 418]|nr:hypothetical protein FRC02_011213 [Tulasnella sp. 418]
MVNNEPLESGIYRIRSLLTGTTLNLVCKAPGDKPIVCVWKTTRSPSELWHVEPQEKGFLLRNVSTSTYLSYEQNRKPDNCVPILGIKQSVEWKIQAVEGYYLIKATDNQDFGLDIDRWRKSDGTRIILFRAHGKENQRWFFEKIVDDKPPSYTKQVYIGPLPAGAYWLGQPHEGGGPSTAIKARSSAALTAAARFPLNEDSTAPAHLSAIPVDGLWPNQIWIVEPGVRGYRLKNQATQSYLNCVNCEPLLESNAHGILAFAEWSMKKKEIGDSSEVPDWWIRPSSDHNVVLGVSKGDMFNKVRVKPLREYDQEGKTNWVYTRWRFEPMDERLLEQEQEPEVQAAAGFGGF